jgi:DNA-binding transcriptional ArsR family regulator
MNWDRYAIFKALGDSTRRLILDELSERNEQTMYELTVHLITKHDVPMGKFRWITLVSPDAHDGTELLLEPNDHPAAKEYQKKIFAEGIPATMFGVADIHNEYKRLLENGVKFTMEPTKMGEVTIAVFDDTCGNLIQILQQ